MLMKVKRVKTLWAQAMVCMLLIIAASAFGEGFNILPIDFFSNQPVEQHAAVQSIDVTAGAPQQQGGQTPDYSALTPYEAPANQDQSGTITALVEPRDSGQYSYYFNVVYADPFTGDMYLFEALPWGSLIECPEFVPELDGYYFGFWYDATLEEIEPFEFPNYAYGDLTLWAYFFPLQEDNGNFIYPLYPGQEELVALYENKVSNLSIEVYSSLGRFIREGEMITVQAELYGFEKIPTSLQWQYSQDGVNWYNAPGGSGISYSFPATMESIHYSWRLAVSVFDIAAFF